MSGKMRRTSKVKVSSNVLFLTWTMWLKSIIYIHQLCISTDSNVNVVADLNEVSSFRAISPALSNRRGSQCSQVTIN